ncbi:MAG: D-2-hydroxyacid dehydrogenase [Armatimonadota bacterium]|nr:D-2-hydroxyacid dehydrogenase [Armatimonadota bacterium]
MKFVVWKAYHLESEDIVSRYLAKVQALVADHQFVICSDEESAKREIVDADVVLCWKITPELFARARRLKWIQFGSAGIDHTVFPELLQSDVILTTLAGIHRVVVAEHVFALMLALARRLNLSCVLQMEHKYERSEIAATADVLAGKTIGIIGLGRIGLNIARLAKAFEMRVVGTKRVLEGRLENIDRIYRASEYRKVLPISDYLVLAVPLTDETRALIGRSEIEAMKPGACLINVARGAMVDHDALADALRSGKLAGAALDVFPAEPLPPDSPLWDLPNTIITPHTAGSHPGYADSAAEIFRQNLEAFLTGGPMVNVYDKHRGY